MTIFARMTFDDPAFSAHRFLLQIRQSSVHGYLYVGRSGLKRSGAEFGKGTFGVGTSFLKSVGRER